MKGIKRLDVESEIISSLVELLKTAQPKFLVSNRGIVYLIAKVCNMSRELTRVHFN